MHKQPDSLFLAPNDTACIVQCYCGMGYDHGQLEFFIDPGSPQDDDDWKWYKASVCYVSLRQPPISGYWRGRFLSRLWRLATLVERVKHCWNVMMGRPFEYDFDISAQTAKDLGDWLHRAKAKSDAVLSNSKNHE